MNKYTENEKVPETVDDGENSAELLELEKRLKIPLHQLYLNSTQSDIDKLGAYIITLPDESHFGFVVPFDAPSNHIRKMLYVMQYAMRIRRLIGMRVDHSQLLRTYGIYPSIMTPITVFQLDSPAESYANKFILPSTIKGFTGLLRRIILLVTGFHPSIAGIILLYQKIKPNSYPVGIAP